MQGTQAKRTRCWAQLTGKQEKRRKVGKGSRGKVGVSRGEAKAKTKVNSKDAANTKTNTRNG